MAKLSIVCPGCSRKYELKTELAGKSIRCLKCQTRIKVRGLKKSNGLQPKDAGATESVVPPRVVSTRRASHKKSSQSSPLKPVVIGAGCLVLVLIAVPVFLFIRSSQHEVDSDSTTANAVVWNAGETAEKSLLYPPQSERSAGQGRDSASNAPLAVLCFS